MIENLTKEKIQVFAKKQWKPLLLGGLIIVSGAITLFIPPAGKKLTRVDNGNSSSTSSTSGSSKNVPTPKKSFDLFGLFSNSSKKDSPSNKSGKQTAQESLKNIPSGNLALPVPPTIIKIGSNGTKTTQVLTGSSTTNTAQGIINPQANIQTGVNSNTQPDNIAIVFKNPDGTSTTYIPPGTPPGEVRWGSYTNNKSKYTINYPVNWQFVYAVDDNGYEGITLYPPDVDPLSPDSPYIAFSFSTIAFNPAGTNLADAQKTPIKVDGVAGNLYTNGPLGQSYITSILDYSNGGFGLSARKSDATFAYVYYYMIQSLTFNAQ